MKTVKVLDKEFSLYIPQEKIEADIQSVADQINRDMEGKNPLFLVVLNGAFMFASEPDLFHHRPSRKKQKHTCVCQVCRSLIP